MTTQLGFQFDAATNSLQLPAATVREPTKAERFFAAHPWFIPWLVGYMKERKAAGDRSCGVRSAMEIARKRFPAKFGETIEGVGKVGLNNNLQSSILRALLVAAPELKEFVRVRER